MSLFAEQPLKPSPVSSPISSSISESPLISLSPLKISPNLAFSSLKYATVLSAIKNKKVSNLSLTLDVYFLGYFSALLVVE